MRNKPEEKWLDLIGLQFAGIAIVMVGGAMIREIGSPGVMIIALGIGSVLFSIALGSARRVRR